MMLTQNSRVSLMFCAESFSPLAVLGELLMDTMIVGGSCAASMKYENGARFSVPVAEREDTNAIGRGVTAEIRNCD